MPATAATPGGIPAEAVAEFLSATIATLDVSIDLDDLFGSYAVHRARIARVRAAMETILGSRVDETHLVVFAAHLRERLAQSLPAYREPPGVVHCGPGQCTCGATVAADGTVTPAGQQ